MKNSTYELELVPIKIDETSIELWTVKRWKDAVETEYENETEYVANFPLWIKIWEASIVLCEHLISENIEKSETILELGAGIGLTGLMLGAAGYTVTLTDYNEDALRLLNKNTEFNKLETVHVKKLDWYQPDIKETYNIIIGSELIYKEEFIEPVLELLGKYLKPDGKIFIAHDMNRHVMSKFLKRAEKAFHIQSRSKTLRSDGDLCKIVIHTLISK